MSRLRPLSNVSEPRADFSTHSGPLPPRLPPPCRPPPLQKGPPTVPTASRARAYYDFPENWATARHALSRARRLAAVSTKNAEYPDRGPAPGGLGRGRKRLPNDTWPETSTFACAPGAGGRGAAGVGTYLRPRGALRPGRRTRGSYNPPTERRDLPKWSPWLIGELNLELSRRAQLIRDLDARFSGDFRSLNSGFRVS